MVWIGLSIFLSSFLVLFSSAGCAYVHPVPVSVLCESASPAREFLQLMLKFHSFLRFSIFYFISCNCVFVFIKIGNESQLINPRVKSVDSRRWIPKTCLKWRNTTYLKTNDRSLGPCCLNGNRLTNFWYLLDLHGWTNCSLEAFSWFYGIIQLHQEVSNCQYPLTLSNFMIKVSRVVLHFAIIVFAFQNRFKTNGKISRVLKIVYDLTTIPLTYCKRFVNFTILLSLQ